MKGACTLHLSPFHGDRWGATDIATLFFYYFPSFDFVFSFSQGVVKLQPYPPRDIILPTLLLSAPSSPSLRWMHAQYCKPTGPYKRTTYEQSINYIYGHSLPVSTHVFSGDYFLKTELTNSSVVFNLQSTVIYWIHGSQQISKCTSSAIP